MSNCQILKFTIRQHNTARPREHQSNVDCLLTSNLWPLASNYQLPKTKDQRPTATHEPTRPTSPHLTSPCPAQPHPHQSWMIDECNRLRRENLSIRRSEADLEDQVEAYIARLTSTPSATPGSVAFGEMGEDSAMGSLEGGDR